MFAIVYNKNTKEINSIVVPDKGEILDIKGINLFDYQDIFVSEDIINELPNVYKLQELINKKI